MDTLLHDLRFAARSLRQQMGVTSIAIACLALGIGANTAIFSVVKAVLLGNLPYAEPDRLMRLSETSPYQGRRTPSNVATLNYYDWRDQNTTFAGIAGYQPTSKNLLGVSDPERPAPPMDPKAASVSSSPWSNA